MYQDGFYDTQRPLQSIKQVILQSQNSKGIEPGIQLLQLNPGKIYSKAGRADCGNDFQTRSGRGIKKCCKIIFAMILQHFL